ncbi:DUF6480 family protein [Streptomyces sp. NPDC003635]
MKRPIASPDETPPREGPIAEAPSEHADDGVWRHPDFWLTLIMLASLVMACVYLART